MLFIPRQFKFKKKQKGKKLNNISKTYNLNTLTNVKFGLKALNTGHINSKQLTAMRQTINKIIKKKGKLRINIFPDLQITKKPLEVRMGKGKGNIDRWVFKVKSGIILCEIETSDIFLATKALKFAQYKMPIKTKIINKL